MSNLGKEALEFARRYVALVDALRAQGVEEQTAREEARAAAVMFMFQAEVRGEESCPLCGHVIEGGD
ncbi:hypothetical protein LCGC14_2919140 [marine sediment metagenome]|uniref:Uncharacterized protein n=1 Tax=marine sediment metagenome TaxID=412755 RepID=A0A0F9AFE6_9ZZZZ